MRPLLIEAPQSSHLTGLPNHLIVFKYPIYSVDCVLHEQSCLLGLVFQVRVIRDLVQCLQLPGTIVELASYGIQVRLHLVT